MCSGKKKNHKGGDNAPILLRPWIFLYRRVPKIVKVPGGASITFALLCSLYLFLWRLVIANVFYSYGWPMDRVTRNAVASCVSIIHSMTLELPLLLCLLTQPYKPSSRMDSAPQWWQDSVNALMEFCTGYMIYDSVNTILYEAWHPGVGFQFTASDLSFFGHHIATSTYMTWSRIIGAGHQSAMILMYTGEFTNPFHNFYLVVNAAVKLDCCGGPQIELLLEYAEFVFGLFYTFFRVIVGPVCALHLTYDLLFTSEGRKNVPIIPKILWLVCCWGVLIGSTPWIFECWEFVTKFLEKKFGFSGFSQEL